MFHRPAVPERHTRHLHPNSYAGMKRKFGWRSVSGLRMTPTILPSEVSRKSRLAGICRITPPRQIRTANGTVSRANPIMIPEFPENTENTANSSKLSDLYRTTFRREYQKY